MKEVIGRTLGIIDENGIIVACSELGKIGESRQRIREELAYSADVVTFEGYTYRYVSTQQKGDTIVFVEGVDQEAAKIVMMRNTTRALSSKILFSITFSRTIFMLSQMSFISRTRSFAQYLLLSSRVRQSSPLMRLLRVLLRIRREIMLLTSASRT